MDSKLKIYFDIYLIIWSWLFYIDLVLWWYKVWMVVWDGRDFGVVFWYFIYVGCDCKWYSFGLDGG